MIRFILCNGTQLLVGLKQVGEIMLHSLITLFILWVIFLFQVF